MRRLTRAPGSAVNRPASITRSAGRLRRSVTAMSTTSTRIPRASTSAISSPAPMPRSARATASSTWRRLTDGSTFAPRTMPVAVAPASAGHLSRTPPELPVFLPLRLVLRTFLLPSRHLVPRPRRLPCSRTTFRSTSMTLLRRFAARSSPLFSRVLRTRPPQLASAMTSPSQPR